MAHIWRLSSRILLVYIYLYLFRTHESTSTSLPSDSTTHSALHQLSNPAHDMLASQPFSSYTCQRRSAYRTSDITAPLTQQEQHRRSELFGHRNSPQHILFRPLVRQSPLPRFRAQRRVNVTGADSIHSDRRISFSWLLAGIWVCFRDRATGKSVLWVTPFRGKRSSELVHCRFRSVVRGSVDAVIGNVT